MPKRGRDGITTSHVHASVVTHMVASDDRLAYLHAKENPRSLAWVIWNQCGV